MNDFYTNYPWLWEKFGEKGKKHTREDNTHHLEPLELAYELNEEAIFRDYTIWLNDVLVPRRIGKDLIIANYEMIQKYLQEVEMDGKERDYYIHLLKTSISYLKRGTDTG